MYFYCLHPISADFALKLIPESVNINLYSISERLLISTQFKVYKNSNSETDEY